MPTTESAEAFIIHISDLHFSGYLQNVYGEGEFSSVAKPHDFNLVVELTSQIKGMLKANNLHQKAAVVITGDLTTAAEPPAYETVASYLLGKVFVSKTFGTGLGLHEEFGMGDRLLVVPGNHDTWLRGGWSPRWKKYADRRELYRQYFGEFAANRIRSMVIGGISIFFFLIDSNQLEGFSFFNFKNLLGRGMLGQHQIASIKAELGELEQHPEKLPDGFNLKSAVRIGVLHHHLDVPKDCPADIEQNLLKLEDAIEVKKLVDYLGLHLVVCGHQHFPYLCEVVTAAAEEGSTEKKVWLSCAGSATQREQKINSYVVYRITSNGAGTNIQYTEFKRDSSKSSPKFRPKTTKTWSLFKRVVTEISDEI